MYLMIYLLMGHDSLLRLTLDSQDLFLNNSDSSEIKIDIYVSTNPFCKSTCEYSLTDISIDKLIHKNSFSTLISNPYSQRYLFQAPDKGAGQKLYRFWVSCVGNKSIFCETKEKSIQKSVIISLNYNLSESQSILREKAVKKLEKLIEGYTELNLLSLENEYLHGVLSEKILTEELKQDNFSGIELQIRKCLEDFENYEYESVMSKTINFSNKTLKKRNTFLKSEVNEYNNLVLLIKGEEETLRNLILQENMSEEDLENTSSFIQKHNLFISTLNSTINIENKNREINELINELKGINLSLNGSKINNLIFETIDSSVLEYLYLNFTKDYSINLSIPLEELICSFGGIKEKCCDDSCTNDATKYPIILLHGHSFNSAISAEKSLKDLRDIQEKLFSDGFLDGGTLLLKSEGVAETFKRTRKQVVFLASYYFDIYKNTEETVILETQSDNLDTYALRINEIVNEVKLKTNKEKVIIITHSMGGLVTRKYLQIFGEEDVEKLIMIGTPNHGIEGIVLSICPVLGSDQHCEDMDKKSLFMNKLTYGKIPEISVENIIGIGCNMENETGDGIAKNSSAYLSWANNYYINGTCDGVNLLHSELPLPNKYPEVYKLILSFLSSSSEGDNSSISNLKENYLTV